MDLIDIFRNFHPNAEEYTFFSSARGTFSRIDCILSHKSSLSKFKKMEIVSCTISDHNTMRLDIIYRKKKTVKHTNSWRLNNTLLNNKEVTEEIKKNLIEKNDNENTMTQKQFGSAFGSAKGTQQKQF